MQKALQALGHGTVNFQTYGRTKVTLRQLALQGGAQVGDFFLVHKQITVAGNAPLIAALYVHAGKKLAHKNADQGSQQHIALGNAGDIIWHTNHTWQGTGCLHNGNRAGAGEGIFTAQLNDVVQAFVVDARKGMRRVQANRREQRHNVTQKGLIRPLTLSRCP